MYKLLQEFSQTHEKIKDQNILVDTNLVDNFAVLQFCQPVLPLFHTKDGTIRIWTRQKISIKLYLDLLSIIMTQNPN